ncbi:hypothetical protein GCM10023317_46620 [Actinopolymorpha pittospori]
MDMPTEYAYPVGTTQTAAPATRDMPRKPNSYSRQRDRHATATEYEWRAAYGLACRLDVKEPHAHWSSRP